jgi:hypothetical protein
MLTVKNQSGDSAGQNKHLKYLNSSSESRIIKAPPRLNPIKRKKKARFFWEAGLFLFSCLKKLNARPFEWGNNDHAYHD